MFLVAIPPVRGNRTCGTESGRPTNAPFLREDKEASASRYLNIYTSWTAIVRCTDERRRPSNRRSAFPESPPESIFRNAEGTSRISNGSAFLAAGPSEIATFRLGGQNRDDRMRADDSERPYRTPPSCTLPLQRFVRATLAVLRRRIRTKRIDGCPLPSGVHGDKDRRRTRRPFRKTRSALRTKTEVSAQQNDGYGNISLESRRIRRSLLFPAASERSISGGTVSGTVSGTSIRRRSRTPPPSPSRTKQYAAVLGFRARPRPSARKREETARSRLFPYEPCATHADRLRPRRGSPFFRRRSPRDGCVA